MVEPPIDRIVHEIVDAFHPRRIMMFGSRARSDEGKDSDVDIFVEMETELSPPERRRAISRLFGVRGWAMDVVVYTPAEVARLRDVVGTLLYTIVREGKVLYESG